ncbi:hypothetical protein As57867_006187, partial [Aphanomyces stellatus]
MANDFWWASFNTTGAQSYLVNWFNTQLQFIPTNSTTTYTLALDSPQHTDMMYLYNLTTPPSLSASSLYVTEIQVNTLANVIASLRKMDGCALPWIFTAYCYVDFDHTFEMANSAARQAKCQQQPLVADGASYLESILRNADWPALTTCWGAALASAILNDVTMTTIGQTWLTQTQAAAASNLQPMAQVEVEVVYWTRRGIVTFTPQWQNFKRVGILETFAIENALGVAYPLTLKRSNGTFQIDRETSFKLYWGFANDLFVVATNGTTPLSGKSLVRASPRFAFANTTLQYVLVANGTLPTPFGPGFSVVQSTLGPFGSISVYRVACPSAVRAWYAAVDTLLRTVLTTNVALQSQFQAIAGQMYYLVGPEAWQANPTLRFFGGNFLCDAQMTPETSMLNFFSVQGSCMAGIGEQLLFTTTHVLAAFVSLPDTPSGADIAAANSLPSSQSSLEQLVGLVHTFTTAAFSPTDIGNLQTLAQAARTTLLTALPPIELIQYSQPAPPTAIPMALLRARLFNTSTPLFDFTSWCYLVDWVQGIREVATFDGDVTAITAISTPST